MTINFVWVSHRWKVFYSLPALILFTLLTSSCRKKQAEPPLFELLLSSQTNIHFVNKLSDEDAPGILKYLYFWEENKTKFIIIIKIIRMQNKTYYL